MENFSRQELNLICLYNPGNRTGLIKELQEMKTYLTPEESDLMGFTNSALRKLQNMTDREFLLLQSSGIDFSLEEEHDQR